MTWTIVIDEGGAVNALGREGEWEIEIIASARFNEEVLTLSQVHFEKLRGRRLGPKQLIDFGRDYLNQHGRGAKVLIVEPAERTTGARRGTTPLPLTIRSDEP